MTDLDSHGYTRDNKCGSCGAPLGYTHAAGCPVDSAQRMRDAHSRRSISEAEFEARTGTAGWSRIDPEMVREIGAARLREQHPELASEMGIFTGPPAEMVERVIYPQPEHHQHRPEDHGPEFWSSGCMQGVCIAERARIRRPEWLRANVPEYAALTAERDEIMRRLHELVAAWDDDAYLDGEWEADAALWGERTVKALRLILGIKAE
jgi:hypothetical protein